MEEELTSCASCPLRLVYWIDLTGLQSLRWATQRQVDAFKIAQLLTITEHSVTCTMLICKSEEAKAAEAYVFNSGHVWPMVCDQDQISSMKVYCCASGPSYCSRYGIAVLACATPPRRRLLLQVLAAVAGPRAGASSSASSTSGTIKCDAAFASFASGGDCSLTL